MSDCRQEWSRREAEKAISDVLDAAKSQPQAVVDFDGTFEIRFIKPPLKKRAADFLAEGGPLED